VKHKRYSTGIELIGKTIVFEANSHATVDQFPFTTCQLIDGVNKSGLCAATKQRYRRDEFVAIEVFEAWGCEATNPHSHFRGSGLGSSHLACNLIDVTHSPQHCALQLAAGPHIDIIMPGPWKKGTFCPMKTPFNTIVFTLVKFLSFVFFHAKGRNLNRYRQSGMCLASMVRV
jgi:hypothetical protein